MPLILVEERWDAIAYTVNALCIIVLETFGLGARGPVETESVANTFFRITSTLCGVSAVFSHLGTLFHT